MINLHSSSSTFSARADRRQIKDDDWEVDVQILGNVVSHVGVDHVGEVHSERVTLR